MNRLPNVDLNRDVSLNPNVRGLRPSATVAINEYSNRLLAQGRTVFKLGLGQSPFPVPEVVTKELKKHAHEKDYLAVRGLRALRRAIASHHERTFGLQCQTEDVLIGPGSKELMFLLQLTYDGELVIPSPAWVSYEPQARIIGRHVSRLDTAMINDWIPEAHALDATWSAEPIKPRILIINYPSNPTGKTVPEEKLKELAEVARKHRVIILSDEIYGKLNYRGEHRSIVPHYPEGTIFSGGLSKWCGAGGWRLGLFVFPRPMRWLLDAMAAVASETYTSTSAPIQYAAVRAFQKSEEIDNYLHHSRRVLHALGSEVTGRLQQAGANLAVPDGGFYVFPDFSSMAARFRERGIRTSTQFCTELLKETGVAILPGSAFGRNESEFSARIAFVDFDGAAALQGSQAVPEEQPLDGSFLNRYCGRVLEAIDRIAAFVQTPGTSRS